jgi:tRNA(Ile)-lysidine synthase
LKKSGRLKSIETTREFHQLFKEEGEKVGANKMAVAHLNDQAETVIMNVLRGTGTDGLKGMQLANNIIRPLLNIDRRDRRLL